MDHKADKWKLGINYDFLLIVDRNAGNTNIYSLENDALRFIYEEDSTLQRWLESTPFNRVVKNNLPPKRIIELVQSPRHPDLDDRELSIFNTQDAIVALQLHQKQVADLFRALVESKCDRGLSASDRNDTRLEIYSQFKQICTENAITVFHSFYKGWQQWRTGKHWIVDGSNPFSKELLFSTKQILGANIVDDDARSFTDWAVSKIIRDSVKIDFDSSGESFQHRRHPVNPENLGDPWCTGGPDFYLDTVPVTDDVCIWVARIRVGSEDSEYLWLAISCGWIERQPGLPASLFGFLCLILRFPLIVLSRLFRH